MASKAALRRWRADFPIVAIGASAGGLDACRKLLDALPAHNGMAFIIVQHLDPSHDSMMVDLLAGHTSMPVLLATDGMAIDRERVYVIPPGVYLSADEKGALRLSKPQARHGARLPFDFLLNSLAREYGARTVCVVLSGTGADGSLGLKAVNGRAASSSRRTSAKPTMTACPEAPSRPAPWISCSAPQRSPRRWSRANGARSLCRSRRRRGRKSRWKLCCLRSSIFCAQRRSTTSPLYKRGTLERRVERRMTLAAIKTAANISNSCFATPASAISSSATC